MRRFSLRYEFTALSAPLKVSGVKFVRPDEIGAGNDLTRVIEQIVVRKNKGFILDYGVLPAKDRLIVRCEAQRWIDTEWRFSVYDTLQMGHAAHGPESSEGLEKERGIL